MSNDNPQTFRARAQRMARHIEDRHGEPLTVYPAVEGTARPNTQAQPDYARGRVIRARFRNKALNVVTVHKTEKAATPVQVSSRHTDVKVSLATLSGLPWPMVTGCFVKRDIEGDLYEVANIMPDGVAFAVLTLRQLGRPSTLSGLATARADVTVATEAPR